MTTALPLEVDVLEGRRDEPGRAGVTGPGPAPGATPGAYPEGFRHSWGLQAIIDMLMARRMMAERGDLTVKMTLLPILRVTAEDPEEIENGYLDVRARRERVRPWDSPRERWRKWYGNFVREIEWALLELRKNITPAQYEELVVGTLATLARIDSGREIAWLNRQVRRSRSKRGQGPPEEPGAIGRLALGVLDPSRFTGFLVGESEITEIDPAAGTATMEVPNCAWHTCPDPDSLPIPGALPEQGCLLVCKGLFERVFDGSEGVQMLFDPHLPETSCTIRVSF